jgi:uncharacterized protein YraI
MENNIHEKVLEPGEKAGNQKLTSRALGLVLTVLLVISCGIFSPPNQPVPTATAAATLTATPALTLTLAFTPTSLPPSLLAGAVVPCLTGPGDGYEPVADLQAGERAEIIGKASGFWIVRTAAGSECWVADQGVTAEGEVAAVPNVEAPPTPAPAAPAAPTGLQTISSICTTDKTARPTKYINQFQLHWQDMSNNEDGFRLYRDGNKVAELSADRTEVIDKMITKNNRVHVYYVTAYNAAGESKSEAIALTCEGGGSGEGGGGGGGGGGGFGP